MINFMPAIDTALDVIGKIATVAGTAKTIADSLDGGSSTQISSTPVVQKSNPVEVVMPSTPSNINHQQLNNLPPIVVNINIYVNDEKVDPSILEGKRHVIIDTNPIKY